ncbi:hypothetical protein AB0B31_35435 [Catellatospora citrea]|uniref:hypothetical protein n=1 Tax=Catellatospora citrea TaxID=53366 RepID=UPI0033F7E82F
MTGDHRAEIAAFVTVPSASTATDVLQAALAWAMHDATQAAAGERAEAYRAVVRLMTALAPARAMPEAVAALIDRARVLPGQDGRHPAVDAVVELADLHGRLLVARTELDRRSAERADLVKARDEHARLTSEIEELNRQQRLASAVPELVRIRNGLQAQVAALDAPVPELERDLVTTAARLADLGTGRVADLSAEVQQALNTTVALESRRTALADELAAGQRRHGELNRSITELEVAVKEADERHATLRARYKAALEARQRRSKADRELGEGLLLAADGLPGVDLDPGIAELLRALTEIDGRLATLERTIGQVADDVGRRYGHERRERMLRDRADGDLT